MTVIAQRRRALLVGLGLIANGTARLAYGATPAIHDRGPGVVRPPKPVPDLAITLDDGRATTLRTLLAGRVTVLQFVVTTCSSSCPVLGAIFQQMEQRMASDTGRDWQLVSLSLDPLGDTPQGLARWMRQFGAGPHWHAALPHVDQTSLVDTLLALGVDGSTDRDRHAASLLVFDRQARLVYRSENFPDSRFMARTVTQLLAQDG